MTSAERHDDLTEINSMFLEAVNKSEITDIVNKCKNKTSTDCDKGDMLLVKRSSGHY